MVCLRAKGRLADGRLELTVVPAASPPPGGSFEGWYDEGQEEYVTEKNAEDQVGSPLPSVTFPLPNVRRVHVLFPRLFPPALRTSSCPFRLASPRTVPYGTIP
eukprot:1138584-Prorocentrum_minimum.AAC.1